MAERRLDTTGWTAEILKIRSWFRPKRIPQWSRGEYVVFRNGLHANIAGRHQNYLEASCAKERTNPARLYPLFRHLSLSAGRDTSANVRFDVTNSPTCEKIIFSKYMPVCSRIEVVPWKLVLPLTLESSYWNETVGTQIGFMRGYISEYRKCWTEWCSNSLSHMLASFGFLLCSEQGSIELTQNNRLFLIATTLDNTALQYCMSLTSKTANLNSR